MKELPQSFLAEMKILLGGEYDAFLASYEERPRTGLRINTAKWSAAEAKERLPFSMERVPWISNGFFYDDGEASPAKHPCYYAGLYYLQEPSAMTPASLLPVSPGQRVLDLCAAPGGKATELGARLEGRGVLFANDISASRARALLKNLELFGISNVMVTSEEPAKLFRAYPGYFDRILVDAPCSGEGMFRREPAMVKSFLERGPEYYAPIQKELLVTAAAMLRPGGMLLYSTCTFSAQENEAVVQYLLDADPSCQVVPVTRQEGFMPGRPDAVPGGDESLKNCVRIWPHHMTGEGHFAALLQKSPEAEGSVWPGVEAQLQSVGQPQISRNGRKRTPGSGYGKSSLAASASGATGAAEAAAFLSDTEFLLRGRQIFVQKERLYLLPEDVQPVPGIRYLRTGLYLGDWKNGKVFEPSQALAMALPREGYCSTLCLEADEAETVKYLKGETLDLGSQTLSRRKGWQLVTLEGWPLGWGKAAGSSLKNKYYPGWRWQS